MNVDPKVDGKLNFFKRIIGSPATKPPRDTGCWHVEGNKLIVELKRAPELNEIGGAIRLESDELSTRVLLFRGDDNQLHAFCNKCTHAGRRLDPVPGAGTVQCCSVGRTTWDYEGNTLRNEENAHATVFPLVENDGFVTITLEGTDEAK